tara:strand:+ start:902 stop:1612 length:711 start_codon:yes stop_codon:yes gene_type:complete
MSIDYKQLQVMVKEAMFTGGGINEPSAPEGIPHRMPAADSADKEQDMGNEDANKMYEFALAAREATEKLVEALDEPIYDGAYENAFKASACLRRVLNDLEGAGAHPMPSQRVVAPPKYQQKYTSGTAAGDFAGGAGMGGFAMPSGAGLYEADDDPLKGFGTDRVSSTEAAKSELESSKAIATKGKLADVDPVETGMIQSVEKIFTKVASAADLKKYRPQVTTLVRAIVKDAAKTKK